MGSTRLLGGLRFPVPSHIPPMTPFGATWGVERGRHSSRSLPSAGPFPYRRNMLYSSSSPAGAPPHKHTFSSFYFKLPLFNSQHPSLNITTIIHYGTIRGSIHIRGVRAITTLPPIQRLPKLSLLKRRPHLLTFTNNCPQIISCSDLRRC